MGVEELKVEGIERFVIVIAVLIARGVFTVYEVVVQRDGVRTQAVGHQLHAEAFAESGSSGRRGAGDEHELHPVSVFAAVVVQKNAKAKAAYRQKYESDFIIADAAARYFRENGISKLPSYKALQAEIETLIQEKNSGYNDYRAKREEYRGLQTVKGNIDQILHRERKPVKRQEQER